jgi:hypothetical protein
MDSGCVVGGCVVADHDGFRISCKENKSPEWSANMETVLSSCIIRLAYVLNITTLLDAADFFKWTLLLKQQQICWLNSHQSYPAVIHCCL